MKTLLLATDLSARSDRAFARAAALTDEFGARLVVIHVVDEDLPSKVRERMRIEAESAIDEQLHALPANVRKSASRIVVFGTGYADIIREAEAMPADLIVMGMHRNATVADLFLGTTVERVIRRGNDPVLVVRDRVDGPYTRVLVAVDFSVYSRRAVEFALALAPRAEFFFVHAFEVPFTGFALPADTGETTERRHERQMGTMLDDEMGAFVSTLASKPRRLETAMLEGPVRAVINNQVNTLQPDLLVLGTHGRTGVAHALLGSVAEDLLRDPPCDALAVKAW